jgi:hypothetical protein
MAGSSGSGMMSGSSVLAFAAIEQSAIKKLITMAV